MEDGDVERASLFRKSRDIGHRILALRMRWRAGARECASFADHVILHVLDDQGRGRWFDPECFFCRHRHFLS